MSRIINSEKTLQRLQGDTEFLGKLYAAFLSDYDERLVLLTNKVTSGDMEEISRKAHSLKGVCSTIDAEILRECAFSLEKAAHERDDELVATAHTVLLAQAGELRGAIEHWLQQHT